MKVAIAHDCNEVSDRIGNCLEYALVTIEDHTVTDRDHLENPGHEAVEIPAFLAIHKVTHVVTGSMERKAVDLFQDNDIDVLLGISGSVETVIREIIDGKIPLGEGSCRQMLECS